MNLARYTRLIGSILHGSSDCIASTDSTRDDTRAAHRPLQIYSRIIAGKPDVQSQISNLDDSIWSMLALHAAGERFLNPPWTQRAESAFDDLILRQQPSGEFLPPDPAKNLESRWYEELVILHALASFAARASTPARSRAVQRAAEFHLNETQPDHATGEPWGLLAFIQYAPSLADQLLHNLLLQYPTGISGIPLLLLTDVRYGLASLSQEPNL